MLWDSVYFLGIKRIPPEQGGFRLGAVDCGPLPFLGYSFSSFSDLVVALPNGVTKWAVAAPAHHLPLAVLVDPFIKGEYPYRPSSRGAIVIHGSHSQVIYQNGTPLPQESLASKHKPPHRDDNGNPAAQQYRPPPHAIPAVLARWLP